MNYGCSNGGRSVLKLREKQLSKDQSFSTGVLRQFEIRMNTLKAFANCSPGFERSGNPGFKVKNPINPERVRQPPNPIRFNKSFIL
jgi:hypothetical protein